MFCVFMSCVWYFVFCGSVVSMIAIFEICRLRYNVFLEWHLCGVGGYELALLPYDSTICDPTGKSRSA